MYLGKHIVVTFLETVKAFHDSSMSPNSVFESGIPKTLCVRKSILSIQFIWFPAVEMHGREHKRTKLDEQNFEMKMRAGSLIDS